jgi:hypothetical protein
VAILENVLLWLDVLFSVRDLLGIARRPRVTAFMFVVKPLEYAFAMSLVAATTTFLQGKPLRLIGVNQPAETAEEVFLWSSFLPNEMWGARTCTNLRSDIMVSPVSTSDPVPLQVMVAERLASKTDAAGRAYRYRMVYCDHSAR